MCTSAFRAQIRANENTKNRVIVSGFAKKRASFKAKSAYVYAIRAVSGERAFKLSAWDLGRFAFFREIRTACAFWALFGALILGESYLVFGLLARFASSAFLLITAVCAVSVRFLRAQKPRVPLWFAHKFREKRSRNPRVPPWFAYDSRVLLCLISANHDGRRGFRRLLCALILS